MVVIIVITDQLLWRPLIAWSDKFKFENVESTEPGHIADPARAAELERAGGFIQRHTLVPLGESIYRIAGAQREERRSEAGKAAGARAAECVSIYVVVGVIAVAGWHCGVPCVAAAAKGCIGHEFLHAARRRGATFVRVNVALLLASAWTIPVGVAIGFNPAWRNITQPLAQIAASFPATALFPVILRGAVPARGWGWASGSVALMMLGAQWYILFNVIAGAMAIPSDLKEVARPLSLSGVQRWTTVILPGIFPFLITGLITASGGAWNASIVAEYFHLKDQHAGDGWAWARRSARRATTGIFRCCWRRRSSWR